jgi:hypothetical protein
MRNTENAASKLVSPAQVPRPTELVAVHVSMRCRSAGCFARLDVLSRAVDHTPCILKPPQLRFPHPHTVTSDRSGICGKLVRWRIETSSRDKLANGHGWDSASRGRASTPTLGISVDLPAGRGGRRLCSPCSSALHPRWGRRAHHLRPSFVVVCGCHRWRLHRPVGCGRLPAKLRCRRGRKAQVHVATRGIAAIRKFDAGRGRHPADPV